MRGVRAHFQQMPGNPSHAFRDSEAHAFRKNRRLHSRIVVSDSGPVLEYSIIVRIRSLEPGSVPGCMERFQMQMKEGSRMPLRRLVLVRVVERRLHEGKQQCQVQQYGSQ
jgi:hypothetical protein